MPRRPKAEFEISAVDRATRVIRNIDDRMGGLGGTARSLGLAVGGIIGARGIADVVQITDRYSTLQKRVQFLTRDTGKFDDVYSGLLKTAIETGGELETSIGNFQALDRVSDQYGLIDSQIVQLNSNLQKLGTIGQTSLEAQARAQFQLAQFFNEGVLRAEEYNSILDQAPEIVALLNRELAASGKTFRQMVIDGEVFADDVINVLLDNTDEINERFEDIPVNLGRAFSALGTSIGSALADLDDAVGFTSGLAQRIQQIADEIRGDDGPTIVEQLDVEISLLEVKISSVSALLSRINSDDVTTSFFAGLGEDASELNSELDALQARLEAANFLREGAVQASSRVPDEEEAVATGRSETAAEARARAAREAQQRRERDERIQFQIEIAQLEFDARDIAERELHEFDLMRIAGFESEKEQLRAEREDQLFDARLDRRRQEMEEELAVELGFQSAKDQQLQELEQEHQQRLKEIRFAGNKDLLDADRFITKFQVGNAVSRTNQLLNLAQSLTAGAATESEKAFKINKAASLAEAVVSTAAGVTRAFRDLPFPASIAAAALIAAKGAAQIATIQSTQFGGGSSGATGFGAGSGIPSLAGESPLRDIPVVDSETASSRVIQLEIIATDDLGEAFANSIAVRSSDGDEVIINDRSRQASELRGRL